jgi:hypothetical protein
MSAEFRTSLKEELAVVRPNLSKSSLQTYASLLVSISKKVNVSTVEGIATSKKKILDIIGKMTSTQSKKTLLSALYILTQDQEYKTKMLAFIKQSNEKYKNQTVSKKLKESYISKAQIQAVYDRVKTAASKVPSIDNYVNYLIVGLMSGLFIAPRRLEYSEVMIRNYNKKKDNFLDIRKKVIGFNSYKTVKTYGFQLIEVPAEILSIMRKFVKLNETDYLLIKNNGKPLSSSELSKRVGKIFGDDQIGVDVLRSMYVSDVYKSVPALNKLENIAEEMGHSVGAAMLFYKKNNVKEA